MEVMLKVGDKVVMNEKYHVSEKDKGKVFTVKSEPQEVCGTLSIWLEGYRGCYAADGLTKVETIEDKKPKCYGIRCATCDCYELCQ